MFLKSITMRGFKSFAEKTVLEFQPGVSVVIGPNGSGKSNITDAFIWVMGEQSAGSLRGERMEDVIFAAGKTGKSAGMAEVEIVLDNSDGTLDVGYAEVRIARRLYASGESEYRLNGAVCRLLDVQEILSDTGLGKEMHSVIGQGRVESVVVSRPEDRRAVLEEAAGLSKYKKRRDRTLSKLSRVQANLERLGDLQHEIENQLKPLQRQARRARDYKNIQKRADGLQAEMVVSGLMALRDEEDGRRKRASLVDGEKEGLSARIRELESELEEVDGLLEAAREESYALDADLSRCLRLEERLRGLSQLLAERRSSRNAEAERLRRELETAVAGASKEAPDGGLEERAREAESAAAAAIAAAEEGAAAVQSSVDGLRRAELEMEKAREALLERERERARTANEAEAASSERAAAEAEVAKVLERQAEVAASLKKALAASVAAGEEAGRAAKAAGAAGKAASEAADLAGKKRAEAEAARLRDVELAGVLAQKSEALRMMEEAAADAGETAGLEALWGSLKVKAGCEKALAAALWHIPQLYICEELPERDGRSGSRCGFLRRLKGGAAKKGSEGLLAAVSGDAGVVNALAALIGDVRLVDELPPTVKSDGKSRYVDRQGNMLIYGVLMVTAGSADDELSRLAELKALQSEISEVVKEREGLGLAALEKELEEALAGEQEARRTEMTAAARSAEATRAEADARNEMERLEKEELALAGTAAASRERTEKAGKRVEKLLLADGKMAAAVELSGKQLDEASVARLRAEEAVAAARDEAMRLKIAAAEAEAAARRAADEMKRMADDRQERIERANRARERLAELDDAVRVLSASLEQLASLQPHAARCREDLSASLIAVREKTEAMRTRREKALADRRELTVSLAAVEERLRDDAVSGAHLEERIRSHIDELRRLIEGDLEEFIAREREPIDVERASRRLQKMRTELAVMGPVNLLAEDELVQVSERLQFVIDQIEDLRASSAELKGIVSELEERIREVYGDMLSRTRENFASVVEALFPGGKGEVLETDDGIEIRIKSENKPYKKLTLMSGGEKALTAIAFLFAIFLSSPCPFYILDEVEAALDDMNIGRFISLIERYRNLAQFVVITHQRTTMKVAEVLYGVTMRDGVSRVLSQKVS